MLMTSRAFSVGGYSSEPAVLTTMRQRPHFWKWYLNSMSPKIKIYMSLENYFRG